MTYIPFNDYGTEIAASRLSPAAGSAATVDPVLKFGRNEVLGTTLADIWDGTGLWPESVVTQTYNIASTAAADKGTAIAGTGARTIQVYGLDNSGNAATEIAILNGTTNVTTSNSYSILFRGIVRSAGTGGENAGNITATGTSDSLMTMQISNNGVIGYNQTLMAVYRVPTGRTGYIYQLYGGVQKKTTAVVDLFLRVKPAGEVWQTKFTAGVSTSGSSHLGHPTPVRMKVEAGSLVKMSAISSAGSTDAYAGFDLALE